ncbi:hypothetical protein HS041_05780 [Planomonospora sp. ID67723]|uniref:hypothetical protein n=1 Tax=Planomonospora sp. ID67723 TaxID=2738134 RepID=UPI0018C3737C|nr:hypothetical protein [Planomonospora sp. ID67723]MBG0827269.1 hypothetical protein [Planomonospora sp. ID67723]
MTTVRRVVAAAAIAPIVSMSAVLASAGPAQAQARLDMPSRVTSGQGVTISGKVDFAFDAILYVNGQEVAKGDHSVTYTWDPGDRPNGSYEIKLVQRGKLLGSKWDETSETLVQAVPPATPGGVAVRLQGDQAVVTWDKGSEPDLRGYEISTSQTGRVGGVQADSACGGGSCKATLAVPAKAAGQRIGFTVQALRSDGGGGTLASGQSAAATVSIPAKAPQATDTEKSGTSRQGTGKSTGTRQGDQSGGKKNDRQSGVESLPQLPPKKPTAAPTRPPRTAVVPTKVPKLPKEVREDTAPSTAGPGTGNNSRDDAGNDRGGGGEDTAPPLDPQTAGTGTDVAPAVNTTITARSAESPAGGVSQGLSIAGGLILLILGAHFGAWLRRKKPAAVPGGSAAMPADRSPRDGSALRDGSAPRDGGDLPPAAGTAPVAARRPAVILAVSKTPHIQPAPEKPSAARPGPAAPPPEAGGTLLPSSPVGAHTADRPLPPSSPAPLHTVDQPVSAVRADSMRLALPAAAPIAEVSVVTPVAVRAGDRWDDYLPPAPRSMEDSGFWERPQPGAADFWAADEDDSAYARRHHPEGG